ncbi:MAG: hypothetical protein AAFU79_26580, partial [Myxococcota bacterium]
MGTLRRQWARSPRDPAPFQTLTARSHRAEAILRIFYAFPPFWVVTHLDLLRPLLDPQAPFLRWPVAWMAWVGVSTAAPILLALALGAFMLGAFLPEHRAIRIAVFVAWLEVLGLGFSFGKIHHLNHGLLFTSFIFAAFVPDAAFRAHSATRTERQHGLLGLHAAMTMLALTYSLAGVGKLLGTAYQAALGQITPLHPSALARHIADRLLQTYPESILGGFMIEYGVWLWPMMLATVYIQLFALVAAFRPRLHRLWGVGLMGFHVVTALTMTIDFSPNLILLGLLWLASPFA